MPRPGSTARGSRANDNAMSSWWKNRKERKKRQEEEAAARIIDDAARNENTFCTVLQGIRFDKSKLPKEKLEIKSNEKNPCGDLEYTARWLEQELRRNTVPVSIDIRPLDKAIYQIVLRFKEAIEQGYCKEAFAARAALYEVFTKIRFRLPQVLPPDCEEDFAREYIKVCSQHIGGWLNLLDQARIADNLASDLSSQERELDRKRTAHNSKLEEYLDGIESDVEKNKVFIELANDDVPFSELSSLAKQIRADSIELDINRVVIDVAERSTEQTRIQLTQAEGRMDMLKAGLASIKIPVNPNAMNNYAEAIKQMMEGMAKQDQEIEESIKYFEEIRGQVKAMDDLPGEIAVREATVRSINETFEELRKQQEAKLAGPQQIVGIMERYGLRTEQEMEEALKEQELLMQQNVVLLEEEEGQLNYN